MASYTCAEAKHATFTGTTADLITFDIPWQVVRVVNKDASDVVYFKVNTTTAPTAAAVDTHIVRAGEAVVFASKNPVKQVYLVGDGGDYSVEGFPGFGSSASSSGGGGSVTAVVTNAGTFATQDSQTKAEDAASANADALFPIGVVRRDSAASSSTTDGDWSTLNVDSTGRVWANVSNTVTIAGAVTNAGTFVVQENGAALTSLQLIDDTILADDAAFTPATSKVSMAGFQADETATDSLDEGDAGAGRMTLDRKQIVTTQPHSAGGLSVMNATSSDGGTALTNSAQAIKASAGQLYGWSIYNPNATAQFVCIYNTAFGSVTVGTTNPLIMLTIPATGAAHVLGSQGIAFGTAMSWAATSTAAGNGAPTTALDATAYYF